MFEYVVIGLLVVIVICLVYWICIRKTDAQLREDYNAALNKSAGVLDAGARAALYALADIRNPTPMDRFTRGRTIYHHVAGGDLAGGTFTRAERQRLATEINEAMEAALAGEDGFGDERNGARVNGAALRPTTHMLTNMDMIRMGILVAGEIGDDAILRQIARDLGNNLNTRGAEARRANTEDIAANAAATTNTRAEAVEKAFNDATVYTDDRQNVHDTAVNADLREIIRRIDSAVVPDAAIAEARAYLADTYPHAGRRAAAIRGLDTAAKGGTVSALGASEDRIFALVWDRAKHPLNEDNAADMREAAINSLADGIENGAQVCVNGRTSRMLASMTMLDYDDVVANGVLTLEAYRNTIFQQTKDIVDAAIDRAKESPDAAMRAVGAAYESGELPGDDPATVTFNANMRRDIDDHITTFTDKMAPDELERVREECYVYASL